MVGVVSPPDTHSKCWIEPEVFPGPPESFEPDNCFIVAPPLSRPITVTPVDAAPIHLTQVFSDELVYRLKMERRRHIFRGSGRGPLIV